MRKSVLSRKSKDSLIYAEHLIKRTPWRMSKKGIYSIGNIEPLNQIKWNKNISLANYSISYRNSEGICLDDCSVYIYIYIYINLMNIGKICKSDVLDHHHDLTLKNSIFTGIGLIA
jgi:hypothetical protein